MFTKANLADHFWILFGNNPPTPNGVTRRVSFSVFLIVLEKGERGGLHLPIPGGPPKNIPGPPQDRHKTAPRPPQDAPRRQQDAPRHTFHLL